MDYKIIITPEAEADIKNAFLWYEENRKGLGHDFLLNIHAGFNFLERNPEIHPNEYKGTRKHLIKRFPYKIIYSVDKNKIIILALLHSKRNPDLLEKRLKDD